MLSHTHGDAVVIEYTYRKFLWRTVSVCFTRVPDLIRDSTRPNTFIIIKDTACLFLCVPFALMVTNIGDKNAGALGPLETMTQTPLIVSHASSPRRGRKEERREEEGEVEGREGEKEEGEMKEEGKGPSHLRMI